MFCAQFWPQLINIVMKYLIFRLNGHEYFDWFAPQRAETYQLHLTEQDGQVSHEKTIRHN